MLMNTKTRDAARKPVYEAAEYPEHEPLMEHPLAILLMQEARKTKKYPRAGDGMRDVWLDNLRFDSKTHRISNDACRTIEYVYETVAIHWSRIIHQHKFNELATMVHADDVSTRARGYFQLYLCDQHIAFEMTPLLRSIYDEVCGIYDQCIDKYCFRLRDDGVLEWTYQTILGGRMMATVTDANTLERNTKTKLEKYGYKI